jgi:phosphoglucomutase
MTTAAMDLLETIEKARGEQKLLDSAAKNLSDWLGGGFLPQWALASIRELVEAGECAELNDRFYQYMEFGTGGMRGRTIGRVMTAAERGHAPEGGHPAHPAVGTNALNDFNIIRGTIGLYRYAEKYLEEQRRFEQPRLVIAHDVRYFSRHFCELAASTWTRLGGRAFIFAGPRSTPQLSYAVRYLKATAGIVITASHNPPHDNGFKVYFEDGAQVVEPQASGIISEVNRVELKDIPGFLEVDLGHVVQLADWVDDAYFQEAASVVLDPEVFAENPLKVVFSPIHGTGGILSVPLMKHCGIRFETVKEQMVQDPSFSTVKSPNPENAEALAMAIELAKRTGADLVIATDPDCDRMGVAVRNGQGELELLTGNQIGALLAEYRITKYKELGWLPKEGTLSAALIKTFVTSELQAAIATRHGLKVINTLTGFKWIAGKIGNWEKDLVRKYREKHGIAIDYDRTHSRKRAELLQEHSTFYVFGGEESYGYLASDLVRDKDGNAAVLMFCELAAAVKKRGEALTDYLDGLYRLYGYYQESLGQIYYEGAAGAAKIRRILESYRSDPPKKIGDADVTKFTDFGRDEIYDTDGMKIPSQNFYMLELSNGYSYAVRGSGTEPKIKFYLFAREEVNEGDLDALKRTTGERLNGLRGAIEQDAAARAER